MCSLWKFCLLTNLVCLYFFRRAKTNCYVPKVIILFIFSMMQADFMKMPFPDNSFDAVYAIEATCHAPDAVSPKNTFWHVNFILQFYGSNCWSGMNIVFYHLSLTFFLVWQYGCYKEIYRVLKPGQHFAAYEWCMTDAFDPNNQEHQKIKVIQLRPLYLAYLLMLYELHWPSSDSAGRNWDWWWSSRYQDDRKMPWSFKASRLWG